MHIANLVTQESVKLTGTPHLVTINQTFIAYTQQLQPNIIQVHHRRCFVTLTDNHPITHLLSTSLGHLITINCQNEIHVILLEPDKQPQYSDLLQIKKRYLTNVYLSDNNLVVESHCNKLSIYNLHDLKPQVYQSSVGIARAYARNDKIAIFTVDNAIKIIEKGEETEYMQLQQAAYVEPVDDNMNYFMIVQGNIVKVVRIRDKRCIAVFQFVGQFTKSVIRGNIIVIASRNDQKERIKAVVLNELLFKMSINMFPTIEKQATVGNPHSFVDCSVQSADSPHTLTIYSLCNQKINISSWDISNEQPQKRLKVQMSSKLLEQLELMIESKMAVIVERVEKIEKRLDLIEKSIESQLQKNQIGEVYKEVFRTELTELADKKIIPNVQQIFNTCMRRLETLLTHSIDYYNEKISFDRLLATEFHQKTIGNVLDMLSRILVLSNVEAENNKLLNRHMQMIVKVGQALVGRCDLIMNTFEKASQRIDEIRELEEADKQQDQVT